MGGFISTVKKVVKWIGGCIYKVISWWNSFRDEVDEKTINWLILSPEESASISSYLFFMQNKKK